MKYRWYHIFEYFYLKYKSEKLLRQSDKRREKINKCIIRMTQITEMLHNSRDEKNGTADKVNE